MTNAKIDKMIESLHLDNYEGYGRDFAHTWDKSLADIRAVIDVAAILKEMSQAEISIKTFQSGLAVSIFRDNSTRTRLAFASACSLLGLMHQEIDEHKSQISHGETIRETANMISFLTEIIGIRDDKFLGIGSRFIQEMGEALDDGYKEGVLHHRPVIINLQDDMDHPTQTLSDLLHIINHIGGYENLKGKKMVMSWAYSPSYGKPLSVPQGIVALMSRFGMDVVFAHPEGYEINSEIIEKTRQFTKESGGNFTISHEFEKAFDNADIVYPKSWAPYSVMEKRTALLMKKDAKGLESLEEECLRQNLRYQDWTYDEKIENRTKGCNALYLHCLPADISNVNCSKGEVTKSLFEKHRINTYHEAKNKAFVIASMALLSCFKDVASLLRCHYDSYLHRPISQNCQIH